MKRFEEYELILFDLDGTLYFQRSFQLCMAILLLWNVLIKKDGKRELDIVLKFRKLKEQALCDDKIYENLTDIFSVSKKEVEEIVDKWIYKRPLSYLAKFKDKKTIEQMYLLKKSGKIVCILSDYPTEDKQKVLGIEGFKGFFTGSLDIGELKPSPKGILYVMNYYGVNDKKKVLMVGDRMSKDGQSALNAGVDYLILKKYRLGRMFFKR